MDIETARAIVADNSRAPHMGDWVVAGRVLYDYWQKHPETLKPARGGVLTTDATRRKETLDDVVQDIRRLRAKIEKLPSRRKLTRDQEPKRVQKLGPPGSFFSIESDTEGCWLVEHTQEPMEMGEGAQSGERPPPSNAELMNASGPLTMGPGMMGDRHRAARAARDRGAAFAVAFNKSQRAKWGQ